MKTCTRRPSSVLLMLVALAGVWACGADPGSATDAATDAAEVSAPDTEPAPDTGPPEALTYNPCDVTEHIGGFQITLDEAFTGINGQVLDGVVPAQVPQEVKVVGQCRLLKARILFCDPACVPGETCSDDGTCIAYPESHSVGVVAISGLKAGVTMEAKWGNHYTNPDQLPHPGFEEGAQIILTAEGGDYEAFTLRGHGVSALEIPADARDVLIGGDDDITLAWNPGAVADAVRMQIEVNINNHGTTSAWIACEADDTGSFVIPGELLAELKAIGVSGFPSIRLSRRSADGAAITPGCVQLVVASEAEYAVDLEGLTSCTKDAQCPKGQTCGVDLSCH